MSAARLREAARVLRERAEAATPGPWEMFRDPIGIHVESGGERGLIADAVYIATMHPGVGLALADWLDTAANNAERNGWMAGYTEAMRGTSAVRIADLILGGTR